MDRKLLKTVQTITTFRNRLADPVGTRRGPPLVRGPQFENRCIKILCYNTIGEAILTCTQKLSENVYLIISYHLFLALTAADNSKN